MFKSLISISLLWNFLLFFFFSKSPKAIIIFNCIATNVETWLWMRKRKGGLKVQPPLQLWASFNNISDLNKWYHVAKSNCHKLTETNFWKLLFVYSLFYHQIYLCSPKKLRRLSKRFFMKPSATYHITWQASINARTSVQFPSEQSSKQPFYWAIMARSIRGVHSRHKGE